MEIKIEFSLIGGPLDGEEGTLTLEEMLPVNKVALPIDKYTYILHINEHKAYYTTEETDVPYVHFTKKTIIPKQNQYFEQLVEICKDPRQLELLRTNVHVMSEQLLKNGQPSLVVLISEGWNNLLHKIKVT